MNSWVGLWVVCENTSGAAQTRGGGVINNSAGKEDSGKVRTNMFPHEQTNWNSSWHNLSPIPAFRLRPRFTSDAPSRRPEGSFKMRSGVVFDNLLPERQSFIYQTPCTSSRIDKQDTERAANRLPFFWLSPSAFFPPFPFSYVRSLSRSLLAFFYVRGGEPAHLWMRQNRRNEWLEEKVAGGITEDLRHFIAWITLRMRLLQEEGRRVGAGLFKRFQWLHTGLSNNIQQDNMTELFFFDRPNQGARERKMERKKLCCWFLSSSCYYDYLSHATFLT